MQSKNSLKPFLLFILFGVGACGSIADDPVMLGVDAGEDPIEVDGGENDPDAGNEVCNSVIAMTRFGGGQDILTINSDGSGLTNITDPGSGQLPSWSPDGTKMVFYSSVGDSLIAMNADGSGQQTLTTGRNPSWSPDGTTIAFTRRLNAQIDIYSINADGSGEVQLTSLGGLRPIWSADSSKIIFEADRDGDRDIFVMNRDGTAQVDLSVNTVTDSRPTISPDSAVVAFASNGALNTVNIDGTGSVVRSLGGLVAAPRFSPDGTQLAYSLEQGGTANLVVSAIDGSGAIIVGQGTQPSWSPTGDAVAYLDETGAVAVADSNAAASGTSISAGGMLTVDWSPCQRF